MRGPVNLADPEREPSDEDLVELSREAFADVGRSNAESLRRLAAEIAVLRREALARIATSRPQPPSR